LKNFSALPSAPGSGVEYVVFVVFWSRFRVLLGCRPGRRPLFQQAGVFSEVRTQDPAYNARQRREDGFCGPSRGGTESTRLWCCMKMQRDEYSGPGHFMCVDRDVPDGAWWRRLGPRLERTHALCEPCVSRTGLSPPVCGKQTRVELHIQDIRPRMLPPSAAPRRQASCTHPCCSFPGSGLSAHGTLHSPAAASFFDIALCTGWRLRVAMCVQKKGPPGRMGRATALLRAGCTARG
jgi:hypothetical protein